MITEYQTTADSSEKMSQTSSEAPSPAKSNPTTKGSSKAPGLLVSDHYHTGPIYTKPNASLTFRHTKPWYVRRSVENPKIYVSLADKDRAKTVPAGDWLKQPSPLAPSEAAYKFLVELEHEKAPPFNGIDIINEQLPIANAVCPAVYFHNGSLERREDTPSNWRSGTDSVMAPNGSRLLECHHAARERPDKSKKASNGLPLSARSGKAIIPIPNEAIALPAVASDKIIYHVADAVPTSNRSVEKETGVYEKITLPHDTGTTIDTARYDETSGAYLPPLCRNVYANPELSKFDIAYICDGFEHAPVTDCPPGYDDGVSDSYQASRDIVEASGGNVICAGESDMDESRALFAPNMFVQPKPCNVRSKAGLAIISERSCSVIDMAYQAYYYVLDTKRTQDPTFTDPNNLTFTAYDCYGAVTPRPKGKWYPEVEALYGYVHNVGKAISAVNFAAATVHAYLVGRQICRARERARRLEPRLTAIPEEYFGSEEAMMSPLLEQARRGFISCMKDLENDFMNPYPFDASEGISYSMPPVARTAMMNILALDVNKQPEALAMIGAMEPSDYDLSHSLPGVVKRSASAYEFAYIWNLWADYFGAVALQLQAVMRGIVHNKGLMTYSTIHVHGARMVTQARRRYLREGLLVFVERLRVYASAAKTTKRRPKNGKISNDPVAYEKKSALPPSFKPYTFEPVMESGKFTARLSLIQHFWFTDRAQIPFFYEHGNLFEPDDVTLARGGERRKTLYGGDYSVEAYAGDPTASAFYPAYRRRDASPNAAATSITRLPSFESDHYPKSKLQEDDTMWLHHAKIFNETREFDPAEDTVRLYGINVEDSLDIRLPFSKQWFDHRNAIVWMSHPSDRPTIEDYENTCVLSDWKEFEVAHSNDFDSRSNAPPRKDTLSELVHRYNIPRLPVPTADGSRALSPPADEPGRAEITVPGPSLALIASLKGRPQPPDDELEKYSERFRRARQRLNARIDMDDFADTDKPPATMTHPADVMTWKMSQVRTLHRIELAEAQADALRKYVKHLDGLESPEKMDDSQPSVSGQQSQHSQLSTATGDVESVFTSTDPEVAKLTTEFNAAHQSERAESMETSSQSAPDSQQPSTSGLYQPGPAGLQQMSRAQHSPL